jgi:glycosyl transferase family 25
MNTKILILNLERSPERLMLMDEQLGGLDLEYETLPAVDGLEQLPEWVINRYDVGYGRRVGRPLAPTEVACYATHFLAWRKCVSENRPLIVLEDDAILGHRFKIFCEYSVDLPEKYSCVRLHAPFRRKYSAVTDFQMTDGLRIIRYNKGPIGAVGYYLAPAAAEKFLDASQRWTRAVDDFMDAFFTGHGIVPFGTVPPVVEHRLGEASTMLGRKRTKGTALQRCCHEVRNGYYHFLRVMFNARFFRF